MTIELVDVVPLREGYYHLVMSTSTGIRLTSEPFWGRGLAVLRAKECTPTGGVWIWSDVDYKRFERLD